MDYVDAKYVGLLSSRLQKFKRVKPTLYNFRCPVCGDSQKNKNKTRGYLYSVKNNTNFKCHNCGASMSLNNFLKKIDGQLHKHYILEKFKEGHTGKNYVAEEPVFKFQAPKFKQKINLPKASENQTAWDYLTRRKLNPNKFYYAENFKEFCNSYKDVFSSTSPKESRIIIPMFCDDNLIGFQGRSLVQNSVKYITVMLDDDAPKIYGLETINKKKPIYIVEGPFDSTFVENSVAMCGSDIDIGSFGWSDCVWVLDNEPRNREIVNRISKLIDRGEKVVIWKTGIIDKDINDMVLSGHDVQEMIESSTYQGLEAKLKFNLWKKV
jgi:transcription elongation factor Elf1